MYRNENPLKIELAKKFRKNSTKSESILWQKLRNRNFMNLKFRRQFPFKGYILDFYCPEKKVCVEINGAVHFLSKEVMDYDFYRKSILNNFNILVIDVYSDDVEKKVEDVLLNVRKKLLTEFGIFDKI